MVETRKMLEPKDIPVVCVPIRKYRKARGILSQYLHRKYREAFSFSKAYLPLSTNTDMSRIRSILFDLEAELLRLPATLLPRRTRSVSLRELEREHRIPLPKSINIIGDIITINRLPGEPSLKFRVGSILRKNFGVRAVFLKKKEISGVTRTTSWERIAGWGDTFTVHRESNCLFAVDISNVFFNPRLSTERTRILRLVSRGEVIIDMFAGVGPFAIIIAKHRDTEVYAIDINPYATRYMEINALLNRVRINILHGDAHKVIHTIDKSADRIIMNYPEGSIGFLKDALLKLSTHGTLHIYVFARGKKYIEKASEEVKERIYEVNNNVEIEEMTIHTVEEVAPYKYLVCVDLTIRRP